MLFLLLLLVSRLAWRLCRGVALARAWMLVGGLRECVESAARFVRKQHVRDVHGNLQQQQTVAAGLDAGATVGGQLAQVSNKVEYY